MPRGGDTGSENQEGAVSFETLRDEGQHFVHVQQYDKAIESFTKALELKPEDQHCLVTRSKCYLQVGNAEASLTDAENALEQNNQLIKGLFQKAEALYQKGDFETALMFYHRGHRLRPELQEFRLGIQKSQEAINNSIGKPESVKLESNKGDMSYFYKQEEEKHEQNDLTRSMDDNNADDEAKAKDPERSQLRSQMEKTRQKQLSEEEAKKQQRGGYSKPTTKKEERKEREAPKSQSDAKTVKQLLGELYGDKEYLEKLLKDQSLTGNTKRNDMSREIKDKVCDGLEYLYGRADFWRQQKPMYARKRDKDLQKKEWNKSRSQPKGSMEKVLRNLEEIDEDAFNRILPALEEIEEAQSDGRYQESLEKARQTLKIVQNASDDDIQNKPELIASLNSSIGNAYLELNKLDRAMEYHEKDLDIAREHNLDDAKSRALDNLGRVYARRGEYEKAIEVWQEKIPASKSPLESTWLYHEIGRCYLELGKYSDARDYGEKSLAAAREADDEGWQLHASVLVAQSEVKLGDYQAASDSFEKSLELARRQGDQGAEDAITRALEEVNDKIVKGVKDEGTEGEEKYESDTFEDTEEQKPQTPERSPTPEPKPAETRPKSVTIKEERDYDDDDDNQRDDKDDDEPRKPEVVENPPMSPTPSGGSQVKKGTPNNAEDDQPQQEQKKQRQQQQHDSGYHADNPEDTTAVDEKDKTSDQKDTESDTA